MIGIYQVIDYLKIVFLFFLELGRLLEEGNAGFPFLIWRLYTVLKSSLWSIDENWDLLRFQESFGNYSRHGLADFESFS